MTFTGYLNYVTPPGMRDELINGEIVLSPSPKPTHQDLCVHIYDLLRNKVRPEFLVRWDTTINLRGWDGEEGPRPDVFVIDRQRWKQAAKSGGYPIGSLQLVVEVKSPSNDLDELKRKAALYLADGAFAVWTVDQEEQCVISHTSDLFGNIGQRRWLPGTLVDLPALISRVEYGCISVTEIFEESDDEG